MLALRRHEPIDRAAKRRVGEHRLRLGVPHQAGIGLWKPGIAAKKAVLAQQLQVANPGERDLFNLRDKQFVLGLVRHDQVDLRHLEAEILEFKAG